MSFYTGSVVCDLCHHEAVLNVDAWPEDVPVPWFAPRMVCTSCGIIGAFARPIWQERTSQERERERESLFYPVTMADDCRYPRALSDMSHSEP